MIFLKKHSEFHGIPLGKLGILGKSQGKLGIPGMQICVPGICHLWTKVIRSSGQPLEGLGVENIFLNFLNF